MIKKSLVLGVATLIISVFILFFAAEIIFDPVHANCTTKMPDIPNVRFINLADSPAVLKYSQFGEAFVNLDPTVGGVIDVSGYRWVSIRIGSTKATSCEMAMGKISNQTLAQAYNVPLDGKIHTFEINGPQMTLVLKGGQPNSTENVKMWVYLRS
jgi:hypothetical protein